MRVLLVEDNAADADRIVEYLSCAERIQLKVSRAANIDAATKALRDGGADVVLLDLTMLDSLQIATIQQLHEFSPETPIVALTGDDEADTVGFIEAGAQDCLPKCSLGTGVLVRTLTHAVERALLQAQMRNIVERTTDSIVIVDRDNIVLFANPAAAALFGRELGGTTFKYSYISGASSEIEVTLSDGLRAAEVRATDIKWYGTPAVLLSIRDITDRKRNEDLQRRLLHADRLASIGQLAAGVAHQINNPAQYVTVNHTCLKNEFDRIADVLKRIRKATLMLDGEAVQVAKLLRDKRIDASMREVNEMLDDNRMGMDRIVAIVKDLRTFARIERETIGLVDVNEVLEVACSMTLNEVKHRAKLIKDFGRVPYVTADRGKLAQVFTNMLLNAAQSIESGAADANRIRITTRTVDDKVEICITDTGCGIPDRIKPMIFRPFFTTKSAEMGTGLGLAMSAEIIRKHEGDITVDSVQGEGTTFTITLPHDNTLELSMEALGAPISQRMARGRVLIVDDEEAVLHAYRRILALDHDVVIALGGRVAIDILDEDSNFDAIVCDLMMPEVDGVAVYEEVKMRAPHLLNHIVFCTGGAFTQRAKAFTERVRNLCLDKPVSFELLRRMVADLCSRKADPEDSGVMYAADL